MEVYDDVHVLVDHSELTDVRFYELSARRVETEDKNEYSLDVLTRVEDDELEVRCRATVRGPRAEHLGDAAAIFTLAELRRVPDEVARAFAEKVG